MSVLTKSRKATKSLKERLITGFLSSVRYLDGPIDCHEQTRKSGQEEFARLVNNFSRFSRPAKEFSITGNCAQSCNLGR